MQVCVGRRINKGSTGWRAAEPERGKLFYAIVRRLKFLSHFLLWEAMNEC